MSSETIRSDEGGNSASALLQQAAVAMRARETNLAEMLLRRVLEIDAGHVPTLHLLGFLAGRSGRDAECVELLSRAVSLGTTEQAIASGELLAAAHRRGGRHADAETAYRAVLALTGRSPVALTGLASLLREQGRAADAERTLRTSPALARHPGVQFELGLALLDQGRAEEAAESLAGAISADPGFVPARAALGSALLATGDLAGAEKAAADAVASAPENPAAVRSLAAVYVAKDRADEAISLCRRALARGEDAGLLNSLGIALKASGDLDGATAAFERATALKPRFVDALFNLARAREDQGRTDDAIALFHELVSLAPDLAAARFALCMAHLPPLYHDEQEIDRRRDAYARELDGLITHADRAGVAVLADGVGTAQPFYLAYQGQNDIELQRRYGALVCRASAAHVPQPALADPPRTGERLRLGVVCGFFRNHSVWRLPTRGWIEGLDRSRFELIAYHTGTLRDDETTRAEALFDRFVQGPLGFDQWRSLIVDHQPDALLYPEIGMDMMAARLATLRLAPVQYASWGHPSTTGYPTIDFFLSSEAMEPAGVERQYTEHLVRLPGLSTPITIVPFAGDTPTRRSLGIAEEAIIYWCAQSLPKYLPQHDHVFAGIAERVPRSRFLFVEFPGSPSITARFRDRLASAFDERGLEATQHCVFLPRLSPEAFVAAMGCADIVLDSIGWSGCNSLVDALSHALPIVTCPGPTMRSRHAAALLHTLGEGELVCRNLQAYMDLAVELADRADLRASFRQRVRSRLAGLSDKTSIRALESHISRSCRDAVLAADIGEVPPYEPAR